MRTATLSPQRRRTLHPRHYRHRHSISHLLYLLLAYAITYYTYPRSAYLRGFEEYCHVPIRCTRVFTGCKSVRQVNAIPE